MLAVLADALEGCDDVVGMDFVHFLVDKKALEDFGVSDGFLALPVWRDIVDHASCQGNKAVTTIIDLAGREENVKLRLIRKRGAASDGKPSKEL
ncbi:MAG: hypothetical protein M1823_008262, partial [Watsoniomyces obsoletus]